MKTKSERKKTKPATTSMIGRRLSKLRQQRGLTQSELSRRTGVAQHLISEYEAGNLRMHGELIALFATTLNVSGDEMLTLNSLEERPPLKEISRKIMNRAETLEDLEPKHQKHILRSIDMLIKGA